jgi:hypothetical protein
MRDTGDTTPEPGAAERIRTAAGELGPLDTQYEEKQKADYPVNTSHLVPGAALRQLQQEVMELCDTLVTRIVKASGSAPSRPAARRRS